MKRRLLWTPFVAGAIAVGILWVAFLRLEPVAVVDSMIESSMSVVRTNGWSDWSTTGAGLDGGTAYIRTLTIERPFHTIRLSQTATSIMSNGEIQIPTGGGVLKTGRVVAATSLGVVALVLGIRCYSAVLRRFLGAR